jgi:hypothetical protein
MMRRELEAELKRLGLRYRFERVIPFFGIAGIIAGVGIMTGGLPLELLYCAPVALLLFFLPVSVHRAARAVNRRHGDDPDMLCAVEGQDSKTPVIQALCHRCRIAASSYLEAWKIGRRWGWIVCSAVWVLPAIVHTEETWSLEPQDTIVADTFASVSKPTESKVTSGQASKEPPANDPVLNKQPAQPTVSAQAAQGRLASLKGTKTKGTTSVESATSFKPETIALPGRGAGGESVAGILTETPKRDTIGTLKEDDLDPSEKYPVEYHEAIREWFLKRRN